jgi:hypothetical protein
MCKKHLQDIEVRRKNYLPHYVTINECLSKLGTEELENIKENDL